MLLRTVKRRGIIWEVKTAQNGQKEQKLLKPVFKPPLGAAERTLLFVMPVFPGPERRPECRTGRPSKVQKVTHMPCTYRVPYVRHELDVEQGRDEVHLLTVLRGIYRVLCGTTGYLGGYRVPPPCSSLRIIKLHSQ